MFSTSHGSRKVFRLHAIAARMKEVISREALSGPVLVAGHTSTRAERDASKF